MPHRMRKIVSHCRPRFGRRHKRYTLDATLHDYSNNAASHSSLNIPEYVTENDQPNAPVEFSSQFSASSLHRDFDNSFTSNNSAMHPTMKNTTSSPNLSAVSTGIVPPPIHSQQPLHMQSTTPSAANGKDEIRGWLYKWTNYLKGYQKRWFVLQAGILSYYRSQDEMSHTCRGTVYLESAHLSSNDSCHFVISNGSTVIHLRTSTENDKQRWMNALELAKQKALKVRKQFHDSDEEISTADDQSRQQASSQQMSMSSPSPAKQSPKSAERTELAAMNKMFDAKLDDLKMCMDLINRHYQALHRTLADLEQLDKSEGTVNTIKSVNERATLFRITSTAMVNACQELVQLIQNQGRKWQKAVQFERDARIRMERMCEQVASQSAKLEKQIQRASRKDKASAKSSDLRTPNEESGSSDSDEFHDAESVFRIPLQHHTSTKEKQSDKIVDGNVSSCDERGDDESGSEGREEENLPVVIVKRTKPAEGASNILAPTTTSKPIENTLKTTGPKRKRRDRIPERPNISINLWSIIKNSVGKDLSKIPVPVNFSEPLSMLQRITEELEYSSVLDIAAKTNDSWEQLAYVAAFTVSSYSTTATRANKPFNPLLGETYECDRTDDLGWRSLAEQVSHHPPALATHTEGSGWTMYQEFTMGSKFRGQYLSVTPLDYSVNHTKTAGRAHRYNETSQCISCIEIEFFLPLCTRHLLLAAGYSHLIFKNTGNHFTWKKVTTLVNNIIVGKLWIDNVGEMDIINHTTKDVCKLKYFQYSYFSKDVPHKVTGVVTDSNSQARWVLSGTWTEKIEGGPVEASSHHRAHSHMEAHNMKVLWERRMPPAYLEKIYNFTQLAVELNEDEPGVAPTDTRRRPDQRLMEEARWDEANQEKLRLEEKQRQTRKLRESEAGGHDPYKSKWFTKRYDSFTESEMFAYTNEYWECKAKQDWSRCDDIF